MKMTLDFTEVSSMSKGTYDLLTAYDDVKAGSRVKDKKSGKEYMVIERTGRKVTLKDLSSGQEIPMSTSRFAITLGECEVKDPSLLEEEFYKSEDT